MNCSAWRPSRLCVRFCVQLGTQREQPHETREPGGTESLGTFFLGQVSGPASRKTIQPTNGRRMPKATPPVALRCDTSELNRPAWRMG